MFPPGTHIVLCSHLLFILSVPCFAASQDAPSAQRPQAKVPGVDLYGDPLPAGAVARLGTVRYRHEGWYKRIAFLADNKSFVVGTKDNTVKVWDAASGKLRYESPLMGARLQAFSVSPDGRKLATLVWTYDQAVSEYTTSLRIESIMSLRPQLVALLKESPRDQTVQIAFTPDAQSLVTGDGQGTVRRWDIATGRERLKRMVINGEIESIAVSPDGARVAIAGRRGVALWDWLTADEPVTLRGLDRGGQVVRFSPDGKLLAVGSDDRAAARIWDVEANRWKHQLYGAASSYYREGLCFTSDGRQLIVPSSGKNAVEFFDVESGKLTRTLDAGGLEPRGTAISGDGRFLAVIGSQAAIAVWDLQSGERISDRYAGHLERPYELSYSPGGDRIATGSVDGTVRIWDATTGKPLRRIQHDSYVAAMVLSPRGDQVLTCSLDDTTRLWDLESGREIFRLPGHGRLGGSHTTSVAFTEDGQRFMTFGSDLMLRVWDRRTGKALEEFAIRPQGLEVREAPDGGVEPVDSPFGRRGGIGFVLDKSLLTPAGQLLLSIKGVLHIFDASTGKELEPVTESGSIEDFHVSPDGARLATLVRQPVDGEQQGQSDPEFLLHLLEYSSKRLMRTIRLPPAFARSLTFSPDGRLLAAGLHSNVPMRKQWISIWDVESGNEYARIQRADAGTPLGFSPDSRQLAASNPDSSVTIWGIASFRNEGQE